MIPLMTSPEVRGYLKISPSTLRRLMERGMPYFGEGRLRRFEKDAVLRWYAGTDWESASADKPGRV